MKFAIVLAFALLAVAAARPNGEATVDVLRSNVQPDGYDFELKTSDGTSKLESGQLINAGSENEAISVKGSYSWVDPEGKTHTINYIADENGYQPQGEDIPVAPVA